MLSSKKRNSCKLAIAYETITLTIISRITNRQTENDRTGRERQQTKHTAVAIINRM